MNKYEKLTNDLKSALEHSLKLVENISENGTMNFDTAGLFLPRWCEEKVREAAKAAGFYLIKMDGKYLGKTGFYTFSYPVGKGDKQSAFAENVTNFLTSYGYDTHCYQECD